MMPIAALPALRDARPTPQRGWLLLFVALAIGVLNPLSCIIHCLDKPAHSSIDTGISWFLCHDLGHLTSNVSFVDIPTDAIIQSPKTAPVFEACILALTLTLAVLHADRRVLSHARLPYRLVIDPPLVPPPQHA